MTAIRLLLIIPFIYFVLKQDHLSAGLTALAAILSDLDGTVARKIGATSTFGALFDPIVDATFMILGYAVLIYKGDLLIWPVAVFLAAAAFKSIPQAQYLKKSGKVRSVIASKTMGMIGFGTVIAAGFGLPTWLTAAALVIGAIGYTYLGVQWLKEFN